MRIVGVFFFKHKTAYELRISDWSSDVCSSDLDVGGIVAAAASHIDPREQRIAQPRRGEQSVEIGSDHFAVRACRAVAFAILQHRERPRGARSARFADRKSVV